jgi:hypothetical protein
MWPSNRHHYQLRELDYLARSDNTRYTILKTEFRTALKLIYRTLIRVPFLAVVTYR